MKNFAAIDIALHLMDCQSMELENGKICYYLHIGEDGRLLPSMYGAACSLCVERTPGDYGFEGDDWTPDDIIYTRESLDDVVFMGIASELTDAANNVLGAQREESFYFPNDANIDKVFGSICPYCLTLDELRELYRGWSIGEPTREAGEWTPGKTFDQWLDEDFHEATKDELDKYGTADNPPEDEENEED